MQSAADQLVHSVTVWTRWWCITARFLRLIFHRKAWGVIGDYLKKEKVTARTDLRIAIAILRRNGLGKARYSEPSRQRPRVVP